MGWGKGGGSPHFPLSEAGRVREGEASPHLALASAQRVALQP